MTDQHISRTDLSEHMFHIFGSDYIITSVNKMSGGAQKVVYIIECMNGFKCVLYVWDISMNYIRSTEAKNLLEQSYGAELFEINNRYLQQMGVSTPAIYYVNRQRRRYPFDYAFVEFVSGKDASSIFNLETKTKDKVLSQISEMLKVMHTHQRKYFGKIYDRQQYKSPCYELMMENALMQLSIVSQHIPTIETNLEPIMQLLKQRYNNIKPRNSYGLIHGELGPDHILIDKDFQPYLIDIEGVMFFDLEHEHSFLQLRFGEYYHYFSIDDLDYTRMLFYRLHHHISLTSGGLKLFYGGFQNKRFAKGIVDYHSKALIQLLS